MIGFEPGARFHCPETGCREDACPVHDGRGRVWRHLDFFRCKAFIHAAMPRVTCPEHGVRTVPAPWAGPGGGFTLLFEAWAVEMARHLPAGTLAGQLDETDTRLWRSVARYVDEARRLEDYMGVEAVGIDGTGRRGRNCITVVAGLVEHDVVNVTPGRDPATVERFARGFMDRNGVPEYVRLVACDMSLGFRKGIRERLPHARRIVDRFHVARHADEAVDKAGKTEGRSDPLPKRTKYLWLRNEESLPDRTAGGDQAQPDGATVEDRPRLPDARGPAGHLHGRPHPVRGVGAPASPVLVDDALEARAHEGLRPSDPPPLRRDRRLLRAPVRRRRARGRRRRHPERQTTGERLPRHGPLRHHDPPDLRQTRPQSRHHHLTITHHKQRIA